MKPRDYRWMSALFALAIFIWVRDASWLGTAAESWPVLLSLPLFAWLAGPWQWAATDETISLTNVAVGVLALALGVLTNLVTLLAAGWTILLWSWLKSRLDSPCRTHVRRLLLLPLLAFPCVICDGQQLGWWFRLSGAALAGDFFSLAGLDVARTGTDLAVNGVPISVAAACAGLNTLQAMLIAGFASAILILGNRARWWWTLPLLGVLAWLANTLRITLIGISALSFGPQFTMGIFHELGGWIVLVLMFGLSVWCFSMAQRLLPEPLK